MHQEGILTELKSESFITKVINKIVKKKGFQEIKANSDGFEPTAAITRKNESESYIPDITASRNNSKFYFEIARKTDQIQKVVSKWKLLSTLADYKNGRLFVVAPYGNFSFAQKLIEKYSINAKLIKIS